MSKTAPATSLTANDVEDLAKAIFKEQRRDALIIAVFRDKNRETPHWLVRWSEGGITRQALIELTPSMPVEKFRDLLIRSIANAAVV